MKTVRPKNAAGVIPDQLRYSESILRTIERLEGKMALMATWEQSGGNKAYLQELRRETTKLRSQLKVKGVLFEDEIDH
jgi:hypothetical protein